MSYKVEILAEKYPNDIHIFVNNILYYINLQNNLEKYRNNFKSFLYDGYARKFMLSDKYINESNEILDSDVLVFEFPDDMEDEVFYFKMKFC